MPKGKKLSQFEKGQVIALSKEGLSHREIAKKLGRSRASIDNFFKRSYQIQLKKCWRAP